MTWRNSFGTKMILMLMVLVIVPLLLQGGYSVSTLVSTTETLVFEENERAAISVQELLTNALEADVRSLLNLAEVVDVSNIDDLSIPMVENAMDVSLFMNQVYVMDSTGMQIYKSSGSLGDRADRVYFQRAMEGDIYFSDAIISKSTGLPIAVLAVPIEERGKVVGVLGASLDLSSLYDLVSKYEDGQGGYAYIVDNTGVIIAHPETSWIEESKSLSEIEPVKRALNSETSYTEYEYGGEKKLSAFTQEPLSGWGIVIQRVSEVAFADAQTKGRNMLLIGLFVAVLAFGFAVYLSRVILKPISEMTEAASTLSSGVLTIEVSDQLLNRKDEFGKMGKAVESLASTYRELIGTLQSEMTNLDDQSSMLTEISSQNGMAIDEVAKSAVSLTDISNSNLETVQSNVALMQTLTASSDETMESANALTEVMEESVKVTAEGLLVMGQSELAMKRTYEQSKTIGRLIENLSDEAKNISSITETIKGISDQTNLLALNAAIEAARAGDAGRGFAVVAEEIRKLAEESTKSAETIAGIISKIVMEVNTTDQNFDQLLAGLDETVENMERLKEQFEVIESQSSSAKTSAIKIASVSESQSKDAEMANGALMNLMEAIDDSNNSTQNISASVEEQAASTEQISEMVSNFKSLSNEILEHTKKFTI